MLKTDVPLWGALQQWRPSDGSSRLCSAPGLFGAMVLSEAEKAARAKAEKEA